jgi:hypothetical protein
MRHRQATALAIASTLLLLPLGLRAAEPPNAAALVAAQRQAMQPLSILDGRWRGPATVTLPDGRRVETTQTERAGSLLGGSIKVIEGRGYGADGTVTFGAFGVISFVPQTGRYNFRSYAQGFAGDFPMEVRADGFSWTIKAGPATLRYTATIREGVWTEIGERLVEGAPPVRTFEMTLQRIGDTDWPDGGAVPAK